MSSRDGLSAQRSIVGLMRDSIKSHTSSREALDKCVLPTFGAASCGASPDVSHVHHTALCVLVDGQKLLLQSQADSIESVLHEDEERRFSRAISKVHGSTHTDDGEVSIDKDSGVLRAHGKPALILSVGLAVVAVVVAVIEVLKIARG